MTSMVETLIRSVVGKGIAVLAAYHRKRLAPHAHPFLNGVHTPMRAELDIDGPRVEGVLPPELNGSYLRIGPNPIAPDPRGYHWFVGDGMVHGVCLRGGRAVWYRNRWIRSKSVAKALGQPAAPGPRHGGFDTVNTAIVGHAGVTRALVEAGGTPVRLDRDLARQAYDDFGGTLSGPFSAHPHRDPLTGELHAITYDARRPDHVNHVVVDAGGAVRRELAIPIADGPMVHDCAITARYVVILDLPVTFDMPALIAGYTFPYRWNPAHPARVGLLPREGGVDSIIWIPVDPCFVFHTVNAYDDEQGRVILDLLVYDRMFDGVPDGPNSNPRGLERWIIDPARAQVRRQLRHAAPQEFPRIDARRAGQPYRYAYSVGLPDAFQAPVYGAGHLFKHDLVAGTQARHDFGPGRMPGEFTFVPRHGGAAEDEGWLIGLVIDTGEEVSDLVVLDARRFEHAPVATVRIPHRVTPGFHGEWIADD